MIFNTWVFVAFFVVVYLIYLRLRHEGQNWLLMSGSLFFYAFWDVRFAVLLVLSSAFDWYCGHRIMQSDDDRTRRFWVGAVVVSNMGILALFKYYDFFVNSLTALLAMLGFHPPSLAIGTVVPVGVSFYTFQTISYVIDLYRGDVKECRSLRDYLLFVSFFPHMIAGPIQRASRLIKQVTLPRTISVATLRLGIWHLVLGYFMKVYAADNLAAIADEAFTHGRTGATLLLGVYAFAFQIYCDFGGYSEMARGLAYLMGFEFLENFNSPYLTTGPREFWRRWHISLSTWLRDYLYIPLGGNHRGVRRMYINLMVTMVLGGLWHGARWKFVLWGLYQGILLVGERLIEPRLPLSRAPSDPWSVGRMLRAAVFFQFTCFGWLIFRCNDVSQVWKVPAAVARNFAWTVADERTLVIIAMLAVPVLILDCCREWVGHGAFVFRWPLPLRWAVCVVMIGLVALFGSRGGAQFIYFQF
jgi:D-alanyl-lipoteichoic acid acyltransferase DltB (MBOAT superfamily)